MNTAQQMARVLEKAVDPVAPMFVHRCRVNVNGVRCDCDGWRLHCHLCPPSIVVINSFTTPAAAGDAARIHLAIFHKIHTGSTP